MKYTVALFLLLASLWADCGGTFIEGIKKAIEETCEENGGEGTYDKLVSSVEEMTNFARRHFDALNVEIKKSSKLEDLNGVFKEYCDLREQLLEHFHKLMDSLTNCAEESKRHLLKVILTAMDSFVGFACERDGERIALFMAEDGFECVSEKWVSLQKCGAETIDTTLDQIEKVGVTKEGCEFYKTMQSCIVKTMTRCDKEIPSKIIDDFFNYMYSLSPCWSLV